MDYFEILLLVHIGGAIIGFGPTFGYAVSGPLTARLEGPAAGGVLQSMVAIEKRLVTPVAVVTQPLSGVLLTFESGRNNDFFSYEWLWISILLYVTAFYLAAFVQTPALEKMIDLGHRGETDSSAFGALAKRTATIGPILIVLLVVIIVLMVVKPGN